MSNIAFVGLGVMGFPMAGHLAAKTAHNVTVYNRTVAKAKDWISRYKGRMAATPAEAARGAEIVFVCVGNDSDLEQVLTGTGGVVEGVGSGSIIVDHTTVSATISRRMAEFFADRGIFFIDAPVSGGQAGAEKGTLTVMAGGDKDAFDRIAPLLRESYAKEVRHMGPSGSGQLAKMVNQICIAGVLQGLSEGIAFGQKAGLDMTEVLAVISKGAAQSWQMDNRGATMLEGKFDFGFAIDWMIKDLNIALDEASRNGANLSQARQVLERYRALSERGFGRLDTSALIKAVGD